MRELYTIPLNSKDQIQTIYRNANLFPVACILNSNIEQQSKQDKYSKYEFLAAIDCISEIPLSGDSFPDLQHYYEDKKDWLFGYLTYDLKNETENLSSTNKDRINFPVIHFFQPRFVISVREGFLTVEYLSDQNTAADVKTVLQELLKKKPSPEIGSQLPLIKEGVNKGQYIEKINKIQQHIQRGDIYEINYCIEYFATETAIDPVNVFLQMNANSPMPFSAFYKLRDHYALCSSPERFLAKRGSKIISQPIKGTAARGIDALEDQKIIQRLQTDPKERSENVMIVDLVRNDLSRTAEIGSVEVESLCEISSFSNLHQMISTITSIQHKDVNWTKVIRCAFPMGSMTGAPKIRAMELIEELEESKRGLYSGAIGYIDPQGDFDFNVVIRSILYNASEKTLSATVGSAITAAAQASDEYLECKLKADSMLRALATLSKEV